MKSLNRPMFRMGGRIINRPSGITAGFNQGGTVRQGYDEGGLSFLDDPYYKTLIEEKKLTKESLDARLAMMENEALPEDSVSGGFNPNMRLVELAGNIMSAPSEGSGVRGLLGTIGAPVAEYAKGVYTDQDAKREKARQRQYDVDEIRLGVDATKYKLASDNLSAYALQSIDKDEFERQKDLVRKSQAVFLNPDSTPEEIINARNDVAAALQGVVGPQSGELSLSKKADFEKAALDMLENAGIEEPSISLIDSVTTLIQYRYVLGQLGYTLSYLEDKNILKSAGVEQKADGGRVGMYMGGDPGIPNANPTPGFEPGSGPVQDPNQPPIMTAQADPGIPNANPTPGFEPGSGPVQDPNQPPIMTAQANPNKLTFQELRARLPMEVSDQVVRLLAASEEALMVFAQIETQQDVSNFNQRFQADLKLPEQVA